MHPFEKSWIKKYRQYINDYPVLVILGAPRTGSTLLYQLLTAWLDVAYVDNLVHMGREMPFLTYLLSSRLFRDQLPTSFESRYGSTNRLYEPSEAGNLWRKWVPEQKHYLYEKDLTEAHLNGFRDFVTAVTNYSQKPLIIKNLYFSQRLRMLKTLGMKFKFIFLRRNPVYTAQSIYLSRQENLTNMNAWWSVKPYNYQDIKDKDVFQQIAAQVYYIEQQIENDLKLFHQRDVMHLQYEDLETKCFDILDDIKEKIGGKFRHNVNPENIDNIRIRNRKKMEEEPFHQLKDEIDKLYGSQMASD